MGWSFRSTCGKRLLSSVWPTKSLGMICSTPTALHCSAGLKKDAFETSFLAISGLSWLKHSPFFHFWSRRLKNGAQWQRKMEGTLQYRYWGVPLEKCQIISLLHECRANCAISVAALAFDQSKVTLILQTNGLNSFKNYEVNLSKQISQ